MDIFKEVKEHVNARNVAEHYGLKISRNGMACCPFHDDHHPSMSFHNGYYHCFSCGAKGDAINYVSEMFGLRPYDATCKIIEDFSLPVKVGYENEKELKEAKINYEKNKREKKHKSGQKDRFRKWCNDTVDKLKECEEIGKQVKEYIFDLLEEDALASYEFGRVVNLESIIDYWLDILCCAPMEDRLSLFIENRKEVEAYVNEFYDIGNRCLGDCWDDSGRRVQHCG